jgi:hypothetical protein
VKGVGCSKRVCDARYGVRSLSQGTWFTLQGMTRKDLGEKISG